MRRQFDLPEGDREYLDTRGYLWESVRNGQRWLIVKQFEVPPGYKTQDVTVALSIEPSYPDTQIDMAYFFPPLELANGRAIAALSTQSIDGQIFQRWSRHRTEQNRWRPDVDCVATHLAQVTSWLKREVEKS